MVKHILSIDFDYIMFPCIRLYNDISNGGENSTVVWNNIEFARGVDEKFLQYDPKAYTSIVKLVQLAMGQDKEVKLIPIDEHQKIVDTLKLEEDYNDSTYDIVNIDFHHDLMYSKQDKNKIVNFDKYTCADWAGYLMLKDKIYNYTWVKAPNSDLYDHGLDGNYDVKFCTETNRIFDNLEAFFSNHPFDEVYLCFSPQWVPYKYKHLYDLIIDLFTPKKKEE